MRHLRSIGLLLLCLCQIPVSAQKKSRREQPIDSVPIWRTQAVEFEQLGQFDATERLLTTLYLRTGSTDVLKDRARVRQSLADSVGCCADLRECRGLGEEWVRRYDQQCIRHDSVDMALSGLSTARFEGIQRVRRIRNIDEGGIRLGLIDAGDTVRVGLVISDGDTLFNKVETPAAFPGGTKVMYEYMGKNLRYPDVAYEVGIQGKVYVQFTVSTDGHIGAAKARSSSHPSLAAEALRLVEAMPAWTPARYRGETVPFRVILPVVFRLM